MTNNKYKSYVFNSQKLTSFMKSTKSVSNFETLLSVNLLEDCNSSTEVGLGLSRVGQAKIKNISRRHFVTGFKDHKNAVVPKVKGQNLHIYIQS